MGRSDAGTYFIALNNEVILPWSEPEKNWDCSLELCKPAFFREWAESGLTEMFSGTLPGIDAGGYKPDRV